MDQDKPIPTPGEPAALAEYVQAEQPVFRVCAWIGRHSDAVAIAAACRDGVKIAFDPVDRTISWPVHIGHRTGRCTIPPNRDIYIVVGPDGKLDAMPGELLRKVLRPKLAFPAGLT